MKGLKMLNKIIKIGAIGLLLTNVVNAKEKYFYVMQIDVKSKKANDNAWDVAGNAPDIKVYIDGEAPKLITPCKDSYRCKLLFLSDKPFWYLEIYDKDTMYDDLIGKGECSIYKEECVLGRSIIKIEKRVLKKVTVSKKQ